MVPLKPKMQLRHCAVPGSKLGIHWLPYQAFHEKKALGRQCEALNISSGAGAEHSLLVQYIRGLARSNWEEPAPLSWAKLGPTAASKLIKVAIYPSEEFGRMKGLIDLIWTREVGS